MILDGEYFGIFSIGILGACFCVICVHVLEYEIKEECPQTF